MKLTRELLADIVEKSSTFDERLANGYFVPRLDPEQSEIDRRVERWREIAAKGDDEQFQKLLLLKGLDVDSIKTGLGPVRLSDEAHLPDWAWLLQDTLQTVVPAGDPPRFVNPSEPWPFQRIVSPFVYVASGRVRATAGSAYDGLTDAAHASLERKLLYWLVNVCSAALMLEFSLFRLKREPTLGRGLSQLLADPSSDIYCDFCEQLLSGGLVPFLQEYSALARAVATVMKNWIDATTEFLSRLESDRDSIARQFHAEQDLGKVEDLSAGLSDPHHGGRSVFALTFSSGLKLMYKPKSLETEQAYTSLLEWINAHHPTLELKGLNVLSRSNYGWAEFIEHGPPASDFERVRFYHRSGMLLCLFYALGSTDIHSENLIAFGEHPVLVDAETLITPSLNDNSSQTDTWAEVLAAHKLNTSVLQVGMLPWWRSSRDGQAQDLSALGGVGGEEVTAAIWQGIETNNVRRQIVTAKVPRNRNVPFAPDEGANPARYVEEVVSGFCEMYGLLREQRDALLAAGSPLDELASSPMRLVFRDTSTYFSILKNSMNAALVRDGADRSIHLELLSRVLLVSDANARFAPFLKAEKRALTDLDIPFFTMCPESRAMNVGNGEIVEDCFPQAGYERVCQQLLGLGQQNLEEQIRIIRGSFWAKAASQRPQRDGVEASLLPNDQPEPIRRQFIGEAIKIARVLQGEAIQGGDGSFAWVSVISQTGTGNYQFGRLGPALFDGLAGVALFLSALESVSGGAEFRKLAMGTLQPISRFLDAYKTLLQAKGKTLQKLTLGLTGLGSIVYAMARVAQLLEEQLPLDIAQSAATLLEAESFGSGNSLDVFSGCAGAILGLLSLYEVRPEKAVLRTAIEFGDQILVSHRTPTNESLRLSLGGGAAAGFVRGPAGVAHALLKLYRTTQEQRFLNAAQELMPMSSEDWDSVDANWSAGAAGIGLSWLHNLAALKSKYSSGVDRAVERCLHVPLGGPDQIYSGIGGRLDFLIEASQHLRYGPEVLTIARKQAGYCVNRAKHESGFRLHAHLPPGAFVAGFYEGLTGVGYEFLRLACPGNLPSVLLWN